MSTWNQVNEALNRVTSVLHSGKRLTPALRALNILLQPHNARMTTRRNHNEVRYLHLEFKSSESGLRGVPLSMALAEVAAVVIRIDSSKARHTVKTRWRT